MKRIFFYIGLQIIIVLTTYATETDELCRLRQNFIHYHLPLGNEQEELKSFLNQLAPEKVISDQVVVELHQRYPFDLPKLHNLITTLQPNGTWPDINYADKKRSGWEPKMHAERIWELAKLYCSDKTEYQRSPEVSRVIHAALNYWFTVKPVCLNWWYNQIGIPKTLGNAFILLEDELSPAEKQSAIEVMENAKFGMTGQNKVWLAGNVMIRAILQNDYSLVKQARDIIASEIMTGGEEGIKEDWSFHQHGAQQQFGNYGLSFVTGMSFFAEIFSGTKLKLDTNQMEILHRLIADGYRWIIWRGQLDISSLDRQLFHNASIHKALSLGFAAAALGEDVFLKDNFPPSISGSTFTGHKHFWKSDYTIHRRPYWMASIKMCSERVVGSEQVNEDNLLGYYMADGATYTYENENDYLNVFPFWDWRKIPGITSYETSQSIKWPKQKRVSNEASFVGGVTDSIHGLTVMDFNRDGLQARKAWVMTDDFVLCLGAAINADSNLTVTTSIDQRLKRDDLLYWQKGKWNIVQDKQAFSTKEQRFFHGRTGYILWGNTPVSSVAYSEKRMGRWHDFMQMYEAEHVEGEVVSLHLDHGKSPKNASYQYLIIPATNREQIANFNLGSVKLICNNGKAQAVKIGNIYYVAAYSPVKLDLTKNMVFDIITPGLYMIISSGKEYEIKYSDPTHQQTSVKVVLNKKQYTFTSSSSSSGKMEGTTISL